MYFNNKLYGNIPVKPLNRESLEVYSVIASRKNNDVANLHKTFQVADRPTKLILGSRNSVTNPLEIR